MANFNRERIAERQPHAKGSGPLDISSYQRLSAYTKAAVSSRNKTDTLIRFSTVAGERAA